MRKSILVVAGVALAACSVSALAADRCRYSAPRNADIDAAGLQALLLSTRSADVQVQGVAGLKTIQMRGTACASDQSWLDDLKVDTGRSGDRASINVVPHGSLTSLFGSGYAYLKLRISVPSTLAVSVDGGSGDMTASALASLDVDGGSGDIRINGIAGALKLRSGSGDVSASGVGSVELGRAGSGDVEIRDVHGSVQAGNTGSGDVDFKNVGGDVGLERTGSGDVDIEGARGNVTIHATHSGDVELDRIGGNVDIGSAGSGSIEADGVGGDFRVGSRGSGDIDYRNVQGKVSVPQRR